MSKRGTAILEEPEPVYASSTNRSGPPRRPSSGSRETINARREFGEDFAEGYGTEDDGREPQTSRPRSSALNLKFQSRLPRSLAGRIATGVALLILAGAGVALLMVTRTFLLHDQRFMIQSDSSIELEGNYHLTRAQLVDIFADDIGRNIFRISLSERQSDLETLPWVKYATVMRLLPGRIRVSIAERTPIAFVRQGSHIGLVDANGILLDMAKDGAASHAEPHYSFPVVTGIFANDPASTRAARMKIFERFTEDLDSSGETVSEVLSEVDLSNPEDVKALIPDHSAEILVHFGDNHFLERYRRFQELLPKWHTQYPNLASVDMRYEREVVLDMAGSSGPKGGTPADASGPISGPISGPVSVPISGPISGPSAVQKKIVGPAAAEPAHAAATHAASTARKLLARESPARKKPASSLKGTALRKRKRIVAIKHARPVTGPVVKPIKKPAPVKAGKTSAPRIFSAPEPASQLPSASAAARLGFPAKPAAGKPAAGGPLLPHSTYQDTYHPPQVAPR